MVINALIFKGEDFLLGFLKHFFIEPQLSKNIGNIEFFRWRRHQKKFWPLKH